MNYPVLAMQHGGFTQMLRSENYWASLPIAFIKLYRRRLDVLFFYGADGNRWRLRSIGLGESTGLIPRVFGLWLGLSLRPVSVVVEFERAGSYATEELRAALRSAVEVDDDILCQFHAKEQVLARLDKTQSVAQIFSLHSWITKEHLRGKGAGELIR